MQDSTHYDRTQAILRKYDPEYAAAQARERALAAQRAAVQLRPPVTPAALTVRFAPPLATSSRLGMQ